MDIAEFVRHVLLILLGNGMCLVLLDSKYNLKKTLSIYSIVTAAVIALGMSIYSLLGRNIFISLYPFIINSTTLAALFLLSKRKGFAVIFTMLTVVIICTIISFPGYYLAQATGQPVWVEILLKMLSAVPVIIFLHRHLCPSYLQMQAVIKKGWGYLCLIPGLYYALILPNLNSISADPSANYKAFLSCILALLIVIVAYGVIFALFYRIMHEMKMRDEQQLLKIQIQAIEEQTDILKANEEKVQIYRHDLRHYIANVQVLIESDNTEEALRVLDSLDETLFRLM